VAKLATPHLNDVVPTLTGLRPVADRLTEVATVGAPLSAVRITVASEQGAVQAVLLLSVGDDNGTPYFTDLSVAVAKGCQPEVTSRVNRLVAGFTVHRAGFTASSIRPIKVGMNWRTKRVSVTSNRRAYDLPVLAKVNVGVGSAHILTRWTVQSTPVAMDTNISAGFAPLSKSSAPKRRTARPRTGSSVTPTIRQQVAPTGPVAGSSGPIAAPPVTPKGSPTVQTAIPTPKAKPSVLPATHPGIFAELASKPYAVHTDPSVQRRLAAAYNGFAKGKLTIVALRGPSGAGKTLAAMDLAVTKGLPFAKFETQGMRDFGDWYGTVGLTESNGASVTGFNPSDLTVAIDANGIYGGIPRLILIDEVTRADTAGALNALLALLDGHGTVYIPDARKSITVDPMVMFVLTANIGTGFNGTLPLDRAVSNRVKSWVMVDYPSPTVEAQIIAEQGGVPAATAAKVAQVATQLRAMANRGDLPVGPSTRQLVAVGEAISNGLTPVEAYEVGFVYEGGMSTEGDGDSDIDKAMLTINAALR